MSNIHHFISPIITHHSQQPDKHKFSRKKHNNNKSHNIQFTVASEEYQKKRQTRTKTQFKKLNDMTHNELKISLIKRKLIKPNSKAPKHILKNIASGLFIDDLYI